MSNDYLDKIFSMLTTFLLIVTYNCKYHVFYWFSRMTRLFFTFTLTGCCETTSFYFATNTGCKCFKWFIVVLMQTHKFCSFYPNCNFYDRNCLMSLAISLGSFANIRLLNLSCAHWKSCMVAFWLLILVIFDPVLIASHLRIKASHIFWLIPRSTLGQISWGAFCIIIAFYDLELFSCSTLCRSRSLQTTSHGLSCVSYSHLWIGHLITTVMGLKDFSCRKTPCV